LTTDAARFEAGGPLRTIHHSILISFPAPGKKKDGHKKEKARKKEIGRKNQDFEGAALPSSLSHGGEGLDSFHCSTRPPGKTHEAWVYGGDGA
jgi:hypothetical protein